METIIIKTKNKADTKFWLDLAKKTGTSAMKLMQADYEDIVLAEMMKKERTGKHVSKGTIMKKLGT